MRNSENCPSVGALEQSSKKEMSEKTKPDSNNSLTQKDAKHNINLDINEFVSRLDGVKKSSTGYMACCPAHEDRHQSLSVSIGENGAIIAYCHAGCDIQKILSAIELEVSDLYPEHTKHNGNGQIYQYRDVNGNLLYEKIRRPNKSFTLRRPVGNGSWEYNRKGIPPTLYNMPEVVLSDSIFVAEGEKDADTLISLGKVGTTGENGAGPGKWKSQYTEALRGKKVCVLFDNDDIGRAFGLETANALSGVAASVKLLGLKHEYPDLPEKGDISDVRDLIGDDATLKLLSQLEKITPEYHPYKQDSFLSCFKTLDRFEEEEAKWLIPGWIPEGQITLLASDGGIGKTTLWCNFIAALSSGASCILDPPGFKREPMRVAFLTTEDSVRKMLRRKLYDAGANMDNIITPDFRADKEGLLRNLKFGSPDMAKFIRHFKPALCVIDPVQGFIPPELNMGSRNAMRDCLASLVFLGEEVGTTFLIIAHSNKRKGAFGRDRIADSADFWDISRSVIMLGQTEEQGVRYLSNEKNNYTQLQETLLFSIASDGKIQKRGTSWKRDREYIMGRTAAKVAPKREECMDFILKILDEAGGTLPNKVLEDLGKSAGHADKTFRNAKDQLKKGGSIEYYQTGQNSNRIWYTKRI